MSELIDATESVIQLLSRAEDMLSEDIQDAQGVAEEASGSAIVYPEDAAPDEDDARGHIRDALDILNGRR